MDSPVFALFVGVAIAIVGVVMAMHPEYRTFGWVVVICLPALLGWSGATWAIKAGGIDTDAPALRSLVLCLAVLLVVAIAAAAMFAIDPPWSADNQKKATFASV